MGTPGFYGSMQAESRNGQINDAEMRKIYDNIPRNIDKWLKSKTLIILRGNDLNIHRNMYREEKERHKIRQAQINREGDRNGQWSGIETMKYNNEWN